MYGRFVGERDQQANTVASRKEPLTALVVGGGVIGAGSCSVSPELKGCVE